MTVRKKPRSESLLIEIRELTEKVREVRLELEELVKRPPGRPVWRMLSSHGERGLANERRRVPEPDRGSVDPDRPTAESDREPDPDADR